MFTTFVWLTNEMNHTSRALSEGRVFVADNATSDCNRSLRSEHKGVIRIKDVIRKFKSPRRTVVNPCAETFATAKT